MALTQWTQDNTITDPELAKQDKAGQIEQLIVEETPNGYQVLVKLSWQAYWSALRTRREVQPRQFAQLERLMAHIREKYPSVEKVELKLLPLGMRAERKQDKPGRPKRNPEAATPRAGKKTAASGSKSARKVDGKAKKAPGKAAKKAPAKKPH